MQRKKEQILVEWLVLSAQFGDMDALSELAKLMYPRLLRFAGRQLQDDEVAKDIVQNTLETMVRDLRRLKDPASFSSWVYRILYRKGVDYVRNQQRRRKVFEDVDIETCRDPEADEHDNGLIQFDTVLSKLDPGSYQVIHLHYLEGLSLNEIAEALKLPAGTVKSRLFNSRRKLRQFIEGDCDE